MRASDPRIAPCLAALLVATAGACLAPLSAAAQNTGGVVLKPSVTETPSAEKVQAAASPKVKPAAAKPAARPASAAKADTTKPAASAASTATPTAAKDASPATGKKKSSQSIVVLVGDEPITGYEVEQRQRLMAQGAGVGQEAQSRFQNMLKTKATQERMQAIQKEVVNANPGKSREELIAIIKGRMQDYAKGLQKQALDSARAGAMSGLRKQALEQVIDDRLMIQEAKRVGVLVSEEEIDKIMTEKAQRSKMTLQQYSAQFQGLGIDFETLRTTYRAQMSWRDVIGRRFGRQIEVTEREVSQIISTRPNDEEDDVELQLQRITLPMPEMLDQKIMAKRFQEAETIWRKFESCKSLPQLAASVPGARLENVGPQRPSAISEPTRGLILSASDGSMIPPSMGQSGMELWAVCGRSVVKADEKKREAIETQLRREQFGLLADRHLKDLRKDTPIEYR